MAEVEIVSTEGEVANTKLETKSPSTRKHILWAVVFCILFVVFCYWQKTGQMTASAAVPSMCVCSMCVGVHIGKFQKERE